MHKGGAGSGAFLCEKFQLAEPGGTDILLETPKYIPSKALEMGVCFHRATVFGNMKSRFLLGLLRKWKHFFIQGIFYDELEKYVKIPSKQKAVQI
jgi:hypothetical protein